jgi:hypothetical protein
MDSSGALYGTTKLGSNSCAGYEEVFECGAVFKLAPPTTVGAAWTYTVLYNFTGEGDGGYPLAGLAIGPDGALYGTTLVGGDQFCNPVLWGCGTVFKLTPPSTAGDVWTESVLHSFTLGSDGGFPSAPLIMDASGALYGITTSGGIRNDTYCPLSFGAGFGTTGCGVVFNLTPSGTESVLYSFSGSDGASPGGPQAVPGVGLLMDRSGALYGTTFVGNLVFKLTPPSTPGAWIENILSSFTGSINSLIFGPHGALYGTTGNTVFKLATVAFAGVPGQPNCIGQSIASLVQQYGGLTAAASVLEYPSVMALQTDIVAFCGG